MYVLLTALGLLKELKMGTEDPVEVDRLGTSEEKVVDILTPPEMEPPKYPTSNLHLLILGAAFFALWAGSVG
jgi:hypothetical protein